MNELLIAEFDTLIQLLENNIPANPNSKKNQRLRKELERSLAKYFGKLESAFPYSKVGDSVSGTKHAVDALLASFDASLTKDLVGHIATIYKIGSDEMVAWGRQARESTRIIEAAPEDFEGPPMQQAINWARDSISKAKLVDGLNEETRKQISTVISDGIKNKRGIPGIKSDIRHKLGWMARGAPSDIKGLTLASRAEMIARTETAKALSQSSLDRMDDMGIDGKEWVTAGDSLVSPECSANEAEGVIPAKQAFSGGKMAPPQHPNCRCAIAPAILKK